MYQFEDDESKTPLEFRRTRKQLKEIDSLQLASIDFVRKCVAEVLNKTGGADSIRECRLTGSTYEEEEREAIQNESAPLSADEAHPRVRGGDPEGISKKRY
jgi:hypothetical protein